LQKAGARAVTQKRDELRTKGIEVTEIVDHQWAQWIYFKDPNGLSLEYCCMVRNPTENDAPMRGAFTVRRDALEPGKAISTEVPRAKPARAKA
jgi:hypothetical protein